MTQLLDAPTARPAVVAGTAILYSVVVPIYGNRDSLAALVERLVALNDSRGGGLEGVFVVDGSPDDSLEVLREILATSPLEAQVLSHSRNFGSAAAVRSGMAVARGDFVAVMAADLQEPPEVVDSFFNLLAANECDIALGQRLGRDDPATSAAMANLYWKFYQRFINSEIPTGGVDIFGCTREIATRIVSFPETHTSLIALLYWLGYRRRYVPYRRQARHSGKSGWTFRRKLRQFFDSIYAFTDLPIILLQVIGFVGTFFSLFIGLMVFARMALWSHQATRLHPDHDRHRGLDLGAVARPWRRGVICLADIREQQAATARARGDPRVLRALSAVATLGETPGQVIRFLLVGGANTVLTGGFFLALSSVVASTLAYTVAFVVGVVFALTVTPRLVFRDARFELAADRAISPGI